MKNCKYEEIEFTTPGEYVGQCRSLWNITEQWDGKKWRAVPNVLDRRPQSRARINLDVEDALHEKPDPADRAFRPRNC